MAVFLITGGLGYIGSHAAVVLMQRGYTVVLLDSLGNSNAVVLSRIEQIVGCSVDFVHGDVRDKQLLKSTMVAYGVAGVLHFAGLKAVGESVAVPVEYYANNVQGCISLLQAMQAANVKTLVFSSSATVYGEPHYLPLDEGHPVQAINPYGRSKLHIEEMLRDLAASDPAWRIIALRYFNPVGAHESALLGDSPKGIPNNLIPYLMRVAAGELPVLQIFGDNCPMIDGTGVRDYIHVMDLVEGHVAALDYMQYESGFHVINLGAGVGYSVLQLVAAFEEVTGQRIPVVRGARRSGDVAACFAGVTRAQTELQWRACRGIQDMCRSAWHFQVGCAQLKV